MSILPRCVGVRPGFGEEILAQSSTAMASEYVKYLDKAPIGRARAHPMAGKLGFGVSFCDIQGTCFGTKTSLPMMKFISLTPGLRSFSFPSIRGLDWWFS